MSIDPKILAKRRETAVAARVEAGGLPALTGTEKQVKWANVIRKKAFGLMLSPAVKEKFSQINDATWWIANKTLMNTLKYKEPAPHQLVGGPPPPPTGRETQPGLLPTASAATDDTTRRVQQLLGEPKPPSVSERMNDCVGFAASVSRHPKKAEAAILSLLSRLYKAPMREQLQAKAMTAVIEAQFEDGRDLDAIKKLLGA